MESLKNRLSDHVKFGPIMWYLIHNISRRISEDIFINILSIIIELIPCNTCKNHAKKYLSENPIIMFKNVYDENTNEKIGMFKWTWKFHNAVNLRLNKPLIDFDVAIKMYPTNDKSSETDDLSHQCLEMCGLAN